MLALHFDPFPALETSRLLLRKITREDAPEIWKLRSDALVMQYIDRERSANLQEAESLIQRISDALDKNEGITWGITLKSHTDTIIGTIGYWRMIPEHFRAEIGYLLGKEHWGKGLMKEAVKTIIDFGFNNIKLHSIEAQINPANIASASLLVATGFVKEAYFRENYFFDGNFKDTEVYSLLQTFTKNSTTEN